MTDPAFTSEPTVAADAATVAALGGWSEALPVDLPWSGIGPLCAAGPGPGPGDDDDDDDDEGGGGGDGGNIDPDDDEGYDGDDDEEEDEEPLQCGPDPRGVPGSLRRGNPWYHSSRAAICEFPKVARRIQGIPGNLIIGF